MSRPVFLVVHTLCCALAEGFVQLVGDLVEAVGGQSLAVWANEVNLDAPLAHGEAFDLLRGIGAK